MALKLKEVKLNDEYVLKEGYARIVDVTYSAKQKQPVYEIHIYKSIQDRDLEKEREKLIKKYLGPLVGKYLQGLTDEERNTFMPSYYSFISSKSIILGTAKVSHYPLRDEVIDIMKEAFVPNVFTEEEFNTDCEILKKGIEVPFTGSFGGDTNDYIFNEDTFSNAYAEIKVLNNLFEDSGDI